MKGQWQSLSHLLHTSKKVQSKQSGDPPRVNSVNKTYSMDKRRMNIWDKNSGQNCLVDSEDGISAFPASVSNMHSSPKNSLLAANGSKIKKYSKRNIMPNLGFQSFIWETVLADASQPILSNDFFCTLILPLTWSTSNSLV